MNSKILNLGWMSCLLLLIGCYENDCGGSSSFVDITGLAGTNLQLNGDGYFNVDTLHGGAEVQAYHYGLKLSPEATYYSYQERKPNIPGLFPGAYACSPLPPQPSEEIADIAIFSTTDYVQANSSKVLAAGDTLNSIFNIYDYYSGRIVGLVDFLIDEELKASEQGFIVQPAVAPASPQIHQLTVHYRLTNGEFYTLTAEPVVLTP